MSDESAPIANPQPKRLAGIASLVIQVPLAILVALGLVLHMTVRDTWQPAAAIFYALPAMLLLLLTIGGLIVSRLSFAWIVATVGIGIWAATQTIAVGPSVAATDAPRFRLMMWNTFIDLLAGPNSIGVRQTINHADPDLALVIEAGRGHDERGVSLDGWRRRLPDYEPLDMRNEFLALLSRRHIAENSPSRLGPLRRIDDLDLPPFGHTRVVTMPLDDASGTTHTITVVLLHPLSSPTWDRSDVFAAVTEHVKALAERGPVILCGDFNLPAESIHLDRLRKTMRRTDDVAPGWRYTPTWPMPLPLLTLDQVWVSDHFVVHASESPYCASSDHQPVVVTVSLR